MAKYALNGELTTPALSDDTRLNLREKTINCTRMLQKPKWRTYWAQIRLIVTIYGENVSPREADWSMVKAQADHPLLVGAVVDWNLGNDLLLFIEEIYMNNTVAIICSKMQNLKQIFQ